ncbi:Adenylate kinase [candidate division SR1 bacterium RAAC1_SR1_1]|nr:Adenylate kinase [candidate division SR1 bacterium RAAC1_SR1_1]
MKNIILSGIQGSGKGTQANLLLQHFGDKIKYFEAGGMLRTLQSRPNTIGDYIGSLIDHGNAVPDVFMVKLFELFLLSMEEGKGMLLDGFPRKPGETEQFIELMKSYNKEFLWVILDISKEIGIKRLTARWLCKGCGAILNQHLHDIAQCPICQSKDLYQRTDDQMIEKIETRFAWYEELCIPTLAKLEAQGLVRHINGDQPIEKVFEELIKIIGG